MAGYSIGKTLNNHVIKSAAFDTTISLPNFSRFVYSVEIAYNAGNPDPRFLIYLTDGTTNIPIADSGILDDGGSIVIVSELLSRSFLISWVGLSAGNSINLYDRLDGVG